MRNFSCWSASVDRLIGQASVNFMMQRRSFAPGAVLNSSLLKRYVLAEAQTWNHWDPRDSSVTYCYISITCGACLIGNIPLAPCCWMHSLMCFDNSCDPWSCSFSWAQIKEVGQGDNDGIGLWGKVTRCISRRGQTRRACWTDCIQTVLSG